MQDLAHTHEPFTDDDLPFGPDCAACDAEARERLEAARAADVAAAGGYWGPLDPSDDEAVWIPVPAPAGPESRTIEVAYSSYDGANRARTFKTLKSAAAFAQRWVGRHPEIGILGATSPDGIGRVMVTGATLDELFPSA